MTEPTIPVIDLAPLREDGPPGFAKVTAEISDACRGIGFFYVVNHGVTPELLANAFEAAMRFFAMPQEFKDSVLFSGTVGNRGYVPMKGEALDPGRPSDLKEAFNIGLDLEADDPEILSGALFRAVNVWPDVIGFREIMLAYFDAIWSLGRQLHRAFAADLGLEQGFFENKLDRPMATLRLLHYPPMPERVETGQLGAGAHTDYGCLTLLATDDAGGLELQARDGRWLKAPYVPGAYLCNIGDCLMRWTNDIYVSTPHRVVNPPRRERYSIAFFLDPNPDAIVECLPACTTTGRPARYQPIRGDHHLLSRLNPTYARSRLSSDAPVTVEA